MDVDGTGRFLSGNVKLSKLLIFAARVAKSSREGDFASDVCGLACVGYPLLVPIRAPSRTDRSQRLFPDPSSVHPSIA